MDNDGINDLYRPFAETGMMISFVINFMNFDVFNGPVLVNFWFHLTTMDAIILDLGEGPAHLENKQKQEAKLQRNSFG